MSIRNYAIKFGLNRSLDYDVTTVAMIVKSA